MLYGDIDRLMAQSHYLDHNIDSLLMSFWFINLRAISWQFHVPEQVFFCIYLKIILVKIYPYLFGEKGLKWSRFRHRHELYTYMCIFLYVCNVGFEELRIISYEFYCVFKYFSPNNDVRRTVNLGKIAKSRYMLYSMIYVHIVFILISHMTQRLWFKDNSKPGPYFLMDCTLCNIGLGILNTLFNVEVKILAIMCLRDEILHLKSSVA